MKIVHLTDSPFFGGPERQILGLAKHLPPAIRTLILCFRDHASAAPFLEQLHREGIDARMLSHANPHFMGMIADVGATLRAENADLLVCHGYKADVLGWIAARHTGVPVLSVSRGWTAHTRKVRCYEALDRRILRYMDAVACVSDAQAAKIERAGVARTRIRVIRNSIDICRFSTPDATARSTLDSFFPQSRSHIVLAIGRLSPEKGFDQLLEAATRVRAQEPMVGFVLVGDGPSRAMLEERARQLDLESHVAFAGYRTDVDSLLPKADLLVQSSHTEGMPNVVLEACAAGVPVVATDVGGTREVVTHGVNGYLVPPGDPSALAASVLSLLNSAERRLAMGDHGREIVRRDFTFASQCARYSALFETMCAARTQRRLSPATG